MASNCTTLPFNSLSNMVVDHNKSSSRKPHSFLSVSNNFHFRFLDEPNSFAGYDNNFPTRCIPLGTSKQRHLVTTYAASLELPLLPFNMNEVLVPSESKELHLYEARYLALLEESLSRNKLFVHFVLDPILISNSGTEASFAARHGCLVFIENIERLDVGALVTIRGIGRVKILNFVLVEPYLTGDVMPVRDLNFDNGSEIASKVRALKEALCNLNSLEIKLKVPKEATLQTHTANSLTWAEKEPSIECNEAFIPSAAERISFAALQPISRSTQSEMAKLQQQKLRAMGIKETSQRLNDSLQLVNENISIVAAKLAIQSLELQ